jgi:hypothetical protein
MARDAQLSGDRVQAEYYLQYAEHYFRVLDEGRSRSDDQRRQRGDNSSDEDENEEEMAEASGEDRNQDDERRQARQRPRAFEPQWRADCGSPA